MALRGEAPTWWKYTLIPVCGGIFCTASRGPFLAVFFVVAIGFIVNRRTLRKTILGTGLVVLALIWVNREAVLE